MGIETGVSTDATVAAARDIAEMLDIKSNSFVVSSGTRQAVMDAAKAHQRYHPA
jgi:hypothetical protein